ncbi:MAG: GAF domain-containing protein [Pseudomonadota bacterium]
MNYSNNQQVKYFDYINRFLSISDLDTLLDTICKETPALMNAKDCSIFLIPTLLKEKQSSDMLNKQDGTSVLASSLKTNYVVLAKTTRDNFKPYVGKAYYSEGFGLTGYIFKTGKSLNINDMGDHNELNNIDPELHWKDAYRGSEERFRGKRKKPYIGVPLKIGQKILGVIRLGEPLVGDSFFPMALSGLESFAAILANVIERISSLQHLKSSIDSLIMIGSLRVKQTIYDAIVKEAALLIGAENCELYLLDRYGEQIVLKAATEGYLKQLLESQNTKAYQRGVGLTGWIFKTGKPLYIHNVEDYTRLQTLSDQDLENVSNGTDINDETERKIKWGDIDGQYKSRATPYPRFIGVPVKSEMGEVIGVLRASSPKEKEVFLHKQDMMLLQNIADNISVIFFNERRESLYNTLIEIGTIYDRDKLFKYVADRVPHLIWGRGCSIFLNDPRSNLLNLAYSSSKSLIGTDKKLMSMTYKYGEGKTGLAAEIGRTLVVNYYGKGKLISERMKEDFEKYKLISPEICIPRYISDESDDHVGIVRMMRNESDDKPFSEQEIEKFFHFCDDELSYREGGLPSHKGSLCETGEKGDSNSFFALPIKLKTGAEDLLGVIRIARTSESVRFSDHDIELLESITGRLTTALEIERAMSKTRESLKILSDINSKIKYFFDTGEILEEILKAVTEGLGYEFATIQLVDVEKNTIYTARARVNPNVQGAMDPTPWLKISHPLNPPEGETRDIHAYVLMEAKKAIVVKDFDIHFDRSIYEKYGHKDLVRAFVPIIAYEPETGKSIGTLEAAHNIFHKAHIDDQELEMLQAIANQAAIVIENYNLLQKSRIDAAKTFHSFKGKTSAIRGQIDNLEDCLNKSGGKNASAIINDLRNAAKAIDKICKRLIDISTPKRAKRETINFSTLISDVVAFRRSDINIDGPHISDTLPLIDLDKESLREALNEIINNSIAAALNRKRNCVNITIKVTSVTNDIISQLPVNTPSQVKTRFKNGGIKILIEDDGPGISIHHKQRIWELGFSKVTGGNGIGLFQVAQMVEDHKGICYEDGQVDKGSRFNILFPVL